MNDVDLIKDGRLKTLVKMIEPSIACAIHTNESITNACNKFQSEEISKLKDLLLDMIASNIILFMTDSDFDIALNHVKELDNLCDKMSIALNNKKVIDLR